jgi:hypothetical protein
MATVTAYLTLLVMLHCMSQELARFGHLETSDLGTLDTSISLFVSKPEALSARQQRARIGGLDRSGPMRPQE